MFKVFGSYAVTERLTVSGYMRVQSGTPWAARGRDWAGAVAELSRAGGQPPQPDVDESRSDGGLPAAASGTPGRVGRSAVC